MSKYQIDCPHCDAALNVPDSLAAGTKIRCTKCEAVFRVPDRDAPEVEAVEVVRQRPDRPMMRKRRFKPKKAAMSGGVLASIIAASCLLIAGAAVGGYYFLKSRGNATAKGHRVPDVVPPAGIGTNIGQLVPEIEGEDIDGVAFKLSDYRGKVVVLDFWGHW